MTAQADRNQSEAKKAEAGPKQRKLLKTTKTETAQAADNRNRNGASRGKHEPKRCKPLKTTNQNGEPQKTKPVGAASGTQA
jgi:hypothetical protein